MRQPMEDRLVTISRAKGSLTFSANFQLIVAMNLCLCGYYGDAVNPCICAPAWVTKYQKRISGPLQYCPKIMMGWQAELITGLNGVLIQSLLLSPGNSGCSGGARVYIQFFKDCFQVSFHGVGGDEEFFCNFFVG